MGGCVHVPGTCVLKMMLHYKHVVLELASCHQGVRGGQVC